MSVPSKQMLAPTHQIAAASDNGAPMQCETKPGARRRPALINCRTFRQGNPMAMPGGFGPSIVSNSGKNVCFSKRPVRVMRYQTIHDNDGNVARGLMLLWDSAHRPFPFQ
jgi:hypothetical protein